MMEQSNSRLESFYTFVVLAIFGILILRFGQLQVYSRDEYFRESERNRIREIIIDAPRGVVRDRFGEILVDNRPSYSVSVIPYEVLNADSALDLLSDVLKEPGDQLSSRIKKRRIGNFNPVKLKRQIEFGILSQLEEYRLDLPGVFYTIESKRYYPAGINAPHLFGYLGEVTSQELAERENRGYRLGDVIGKKGLELEYEEFLRGKAGVKYVEVDALGREVRDLSEFPLQSPVPGNLLYLNIHAGIQRYIEEVMDDKRGAAAVLDPRTGGVLAILSKPDYDPTLFSKPIAPDIWQSLLNDEGRPLYDRVSQSLYPPGSTYKLVLAAACVETGKVDLEKRVYCGGSYRLGRRSFRCWKREGHGPVNFNEAIEQSCNVYFFTQVLEIGLDTWSQFSRMFTFGRKTGIDLPNESSGLVPDREYFNKKYGVRGWTRGLLLNLAVGQGDLLTTPLQMAYFAMILGNEGVAYRPHLLNKLVDPRTGEIRPAVIDTVRIDGISKDTYKRIKHGMYLVVNGGRGTARSAWMRNIKVCGKTGTAQNPHGEDHAWFIGFAPMDNPEIAFCIMVENGGSGGAVAAPIAGGILKRYFTPDKVGQK